MPATSGGNDPSLFSNLLSPLQPPFHQLSIVFPEGNRNAKDKKEKMASNTQACQNFDVPAERNKRTLKKPRPRAKRKTILECSVIKGLQTCRVNLDKGGGVVCDEARKIWDAAWYCFRPVFGREGSR